MIAKQYRFHGRGGIPFVLRKGKRLSCGNINANFYKNYRPRNPRIAVIAGKKLSKHAPVRNRVRRQVFEEIRRQNWHQELKGFDVVIIIKQLSGDRQLSSSQLALDLKQIKDRLREPQK